MMYSVVSKYRDHSTRTYNNTLYVQNMATQKKDPYTFI